MPKALITGATGLLGRAIFDSFQIAGWDVIGTGLTRSGENKNIVKLDLLDERAISDLVENHHPDFIIHSAADRSPDSVAANPARAIALNVTATAHLTSLATSLQIPILYISTDYVFPGVPGEAPYSESSPPRATNLYGQLKLDGEKAVLGKAATQTGIPLSAVLRVPVLYGTVDESVGNKESAVNVLVDKVREVAAGKKVVMDDWARRYPTCVEDVGEAVVRVGEKWLGIIGKSGEEFGRVLQFSAKECFTKYEMCQVFAEILGVDISGMERDTDGGGGGGVQRPYDTQLATGQLEKLLGGSLSTVKFREWWTKELKA